MVIYTYEEIHIVKHLLSSISEILSTLDQIGLKNLKGGEKWDINMKPTTSKYEKKSKNITKKTTKHQIKWQTNVFVIENLIDENEMEDGLIKINTNNILTIRP